MLSGELLGLSDVSDNTNLVKCIRLPDGTANEFAYSSSLKIVNCSAKLGLIRLSVCSDLVAGNSGTFDETSPTLEEKTAFVIGGNEATVAEDFDIVEVSDITVLSGWGSLTRVVASRFFL